MRPLRTKVIGGRKVEEYYWAGDYVCYLDNRLQDGRSFESVVEELSKEAAEKESDK